MKKVLSVFLLGAFALTSFAQKAVYESKFFDNWSLGVVGGGIVPASHSAFWGGMRPAYGLELTKQISPVFALGIQGTAASNVSESYTMVDASNVSLLGKLNVTNLFWGYKGEPRLFEVEAVAGAGWGHNYNGGASDNNYLTSKYGLNLNFNLGKKKAWTVAVKPAIVYNMDTQPDAQYNVNNAAIEVMAGVTYHFKNSNGKHSFSYAKLYDQAEVDGLNAKINDLRAGLNERDAMLAKEKQTVGKLKAELNDWRNRKPVVETVVVRKTTNTKTLESVVTFRQGKTTVDASQLPNVERVATYLKNHKEAKVTIKGYASPEGSAEVNARIAKARAEAVKNLLVNKYKVAAERITAGGEGVGNMFEEPDWNRVSICTIDDNK